MGPKRQSVSNPPPPAKKDEKKAEPKQEVKPVGSKPQKKAGFGQRKSDCFFIVTYLAWAFVAFLLFVARCEDLLPAKVNDVDFAEPICGTLKKLEGPLRPFLESHQQWRQKMFVQEADFALDVVHYVNLFFVAPVALVLAWGFFAGYQCIKNIALVHAAVMLYNMIIVDIYAIEVLAKFDILDLENVAMGAFVAYSFCTIFPLVVMKRVWSPTPFAASTVKRGFIARTIAFFTKTLLFFWLVGTATGLYEFSVKNTASMQDMPSVVKCSIEGWERAGPVREQASVYVADAGDYAGQLVVEGFATAKVVAADVGEKVAKLFEEYGGSGAKKTEASETVEVKKEAAPQKPSEPAAKPVEVPESQPDAP